MRISDEKEVASGRIRAQISRGGPFYDTVTSLRTTRTSA